MSFLFKCQIQTRVALIVPGGAAIYLPDTPHRAEWIRPWRGVTLKVRISVRKVSRGFSHEETVIGASVYKLESRAPSSFSLKLHKMRVAKSSKLNNLFRNGH